MTDDVVISVGGQYIAGWQQVRVTRGVERFPSDFEITATERFPMSANDLAIVPGSDVEVYIGQNLVLTGYLDRYQPEVSAHSHSIRLAGRSKCEDLVDCSVDINNSTINGPDALTIATTLASPYGISVTNRSGSPGPTIPVFNINLTETPFEIVERVSHYAGFLAYDDTAGNLVLARGPTGAMASGFTQGGNVQSAAAAFSMDQRYRTYKCVLQSVDVYKDIGTNNGVQQATDPGARADRTLYIITPQTIPGGSLQQQTAAWAMNRRWGRSQAVRIVCDSWRDTAGTLWEPNTTATVDVAAVKVVNQNWVISEVSYIRDLQTGTRAELVLMPPQAFSVQPEALQAWQPDIAQGLAGSPT